jgi:hypothetical protein
LQLSSHAIAKDMDEDSEEALEDDEDWEAKQYRLGRELKQKLISKQNKVPKTGKGKYNVTVPVPFEFSNAEKGFSIRGKKVEKMVADKRRQEEKALAFVYKARDVPRHVKEDKFARITTANEERREEAKRLAMAKIKSTEAPFKFYERDVRASKER